MLRQRYPEVFEALNTARTPNNSDFHDEQLAQFLVDIQEGQQTESDQGKESQEGESQDETRDIDLMASDYEDDEEEIESQNEQDRVSRRRDRRTGRCVLLQKIPGRTG